MTGSSWSFRDYADLELTVARPSHSAPESPFSDQHRGSPLFSALRGSEAGTSTRSLDPSEAVPALAAAVGVAGRAQLREDFAALREVLLGDLRAFWRSLQDENKLYFARQDEELRRLLAERGKGAPWPMTPPNVREEKHSDLRSATAAAPKAKDVQESSSSRPGHWEPPPLPEVFTSPPPSARLPNMSMELSTSSMEPASEPPLAQQPAQEPEQKEQKEQDDLALIMCASRNEDLEPEQPEPKKAYNGHHIHHPDDDHKRELHNGAFSHEPDRSRLDDNEYDVSSFYKKQGLVQRVARSKIFDDMTLSVITLNAVYLGVEADNNQETDIMDYSWPFFLAEQFFCVYFTSEILIRFFAFQRKRDALSDRWFKFDSLLVSLMVFETWVMPGVTLIAGFDLETVDITPLKLLRMLRLSRLVRLMRALPELMMMIKGMFVASRAMLCSLLLVVMIIYVFAIVLHMLLKDLEDLSHNFGTLPRCMWTLFMDGTLLDGVGPLIRQLLDIGTLVSLLSAWIFVLFVLLSAMTVMNMLVGVLCEVVSSVAQTEKDEAAIRLVKRSILVELKKFDGDGSGTINRKELGQVMRNPQALRALRGLEVDVGCLEELQAMILPTAESQVKIGSVMNSLLLYRGNTPTTVKHVVDAQTYTRHCLDERMQRHETTLSRQFTEIKQLIAGTLPVGHASSI